MDYKAYARNWVKRMEEANARDDEDAISALVAEAVAEVFDLVQRGVVALEKTARNITP